MENNDERNFICEICEKRFKNNSSIRKHIKIVHGEEKEFACNVCNKKFSEQFELTIHNENNHQSKDHICKDCERLIRNLGAL